MDKQALRKKMKNLLQQISAHEIEMASWKITNQIIELHQWQHSQTIGITIPIGKEIVTYPLIEIGWSENKRIVVPKTIQQTREMEFYELTDYSQLEETHFGLKEPMDGKCSLVTKNNIDMLIIPCLAFDADLYRLGYGGGYYDRYLADFLGVTCGIALDCQKILQVPKNEYDIPLMLIVTEKQVYT